jgi:peptide chain release factor 2
MAGPSFWDDPVQAQAANKRLASLRERIDGWALLDGRAADALVLLDLAEEEDDAGAVAEAAEEIRQLAGELDARELEVLLRGPYDRGGAIMSLHAGAGGTESQDWVEMLLRLYSRWADRHRYKVEVLDQLPGEEAGIKSVTISVDGPNVFGYLAAEKGVHRLVRISPFDASARRHTSFASVEVLPLADDKVEVAVNPDDLKIDTYRSGGAGGQHVNKTDSAVRITHLPTGIVVTCQNERSQIANRLTAMKLLQAKLLDRELKKREEELARMRGEQQEIGWGSQIRSYVFHPYSLVKDHRTGVEVGNVGAVMDGEIDAFIAAYLREKARGEGR